jgi:5-methylcytosine-specific restriction endonuclease McrA
MELSHRSDHELLSDVTKLIGAHRAITAKLVQYLAEIEERRLHLKAGFPSMFAYCVKQLGLGETEAFRRIVAARLGRRFPVVYSLLASGRVHLSALELLRERLTEENHRELLEAVAGKSKREIEGILAALFPRPDAPSSIRRLSNPPVAPSVQASAAAGFELRPCGNDHEQRSSGARIEQVSSERYRVEFTASAELREKLELCRDLMSHANPSRDLGVVVERAVELLLADLERKRLARTKRTAPGRTFESSKSARIANATRRRVFERDGLRCTYVSPEGQLCGARAFLELDHVEPRALGGANHSENLRVRCRAHNQHWAEQVFGRELVERRKHFRQRKRVTTDQCREDNPTQAEGAALMTVLEKVRQALTKMGFRDAQARCAVAEVQRRHYEAPSVGQFLREAVLVATAKCA